MKKILLVEDNPEAAENIADILIISGYIVYVASNGDKGQQSLFGYRPDLIISDITMPGMDGLELLDLVRKNPVYNKIPFVFLSGRSKEEDVVLGINAGANEYLLKPCDADQLIQSVSRLIDRQSGEVLMRVDPL